MIRKLNLHSAARCFILLLGFQSSDGERYSLRRSGRTFEDRNPTAELQSEDRLEELPFYWERMLQLQSSMDLSETPSRAPTSKPSGSPTMTIQPSEQPSSLPTPEPSTIPTPSPTETASANPTPIPTERPSLMPSNGPTLSQIPSNEPTRFSTTLSLQNEVGICQADVNGVGCAAVEADGTGGNPNDLVNCFNITDFGGTTPYFIDSVRFWLPDTIPLPLDLSVTVWNNGGNGPIGSPIYREEVFGFAPGENFFPLSPTEFDASLICIGLFSGTATSGLRVLTEPGDGDQSFVLAPACNVLQFCPLEQVAPQFDFCIEASIFG